MKKNHTNTIKKQKLRSSKDGQAQGKWNISPNTEITTSYLQPYNHPTYNIKSGDSDNTGPAGHVKGRNRGQIRPWTRWVSDSICLLQGEEQSHHMWVPQMSLLHSQYLILNKGNTPSIEYLQLPLIPVEDARAQPRPSTPDRPRHSLQNKFQRLF